MKQKGLKAEEDSLQAFHLRNCYQRPRDTLHRPCLTCSLIHCSYTYREEQPKQCSPLGRLLPFFPPKEPRNNSIFRETKTAGKGFEVTQQAPGPGTGRRWVSEPHALHSRPLCSQLLAPGPSAPGHVPHQRQQDRGLLAPQLGSLRQPVHIN